jgi:hypothetical protein
MEIRREENGEVEGFKGKDLCIGCLDFIPRPGGSSQIQT